MSSLPDLVAAPVQLRLGRKQLLLSPLTIGDLGMYERMGGQYDSLIDGENCKLLFWLSLRKEHPSITYKQASKMLRRSRGINNVIAALVSLNESAFKTEEKQNPTEQKEPTGYAPIFRLLSRVYGWTVPVISALTIEQVNVYLRDIEAGGSDRIKFNSYEEARRYVDDRQKAKAG